MNDIIWEEPPSGTRGNGRDSMLRKVLAELQANPGRWARVAESKATGGQGSWWRKHGCEATTRRIREKGVTYTYARWPESAEAEPEKPVERVAPAPAKKPRKPASTPRTGRASSWTEREADEVLAARLRGTSLADLEGRFGYPCSTIRRMIADAEARHQRAEEAKEAASRFRTASLVTSMQKGTCRACNAKNRGLTEGICRMCITRQRERAALKVAS